MTEERKKLGPPDLDPHRQPQSMAFRRLPGVM
jgi:hypothetical protein